MNLLRIFTIDFTLNATIVAVAICATVCYLGFTSMKRNQQAKP